MYTVLADMVPGVAMVAKVLLGCCLLAQVESVYILVPFKANQPLRNMFIFIYFIFNSYIHPLIFKMFIRLVVFCSIVCVVLKN